MRVIFVAVEIKIFTNLLWLGEWSGCGCVCGVRLAKECCDQVSGMGHTGPGKSAGPDGIPAEVYKAHEGVVAPVLTDLHNQSLDTGLLPFTMREGDIILLPMLSKRRRP